MSTSNIVPFTLAVPDNEVADLQRRLAMTRWPDQLEGQEWVYGTDLGELQDLASYWCDSFDWRKAEQGLNQWSQFRTNLDGEQVHFIHARSSRDDARPLLLTHGWPGSVVEFLHLIGPLTEPEDPSAPAFHVIVPSLPGFTLSGPSVTVGVSPKRIAGMWATLMSRLGYTGYLAQGGDWGGIITSWIGQLDPGNCVGIHLNMLPVSPSEEAMADMTGDEEAKLGATMQFQVKETGYQAIQSTKPQTLAAGLADSPAGQLSWILEKFRSWSDCGGNVFSVHDRDTFLTNVSLYWFTNTAGSSARIYHAFAATDERAMADAVTVPTAVADFPKEIYRTSQRWASMTHNLVQWSSFDRGGHFAALEQPDLLLNDVRKFAQTLSD